MFHGNVHRHLLILSLANWAIAIVCWTISAYLGITSPTGIFVYTVLFVIGLFAVLVAIGSFVLADFGAEPARAAVATGVAGGDDEAPTVVAAAAGADARGSEATPAEKAEPVSAGEPADKARAKPAATPAEKPAATSAEKPATAPEAKPADKSADKPAAPGA